MRKSPVTATATAQGWFLRRRVVVGHPPRRRLCSAPSSLSSWDRQQYYANQWRSERLRNNFAKFQHARNIRIFSSMQSPFTEQQHFLHGGGTVDILDEGKNLSIQWPDTMVVVSSQQKTTTISAPWLWVQDPKFIHSSSGQRLRTFGQYNMSGQHSIVQATLLFVQDTSMDGVDINELHPKPPLGSYHPRGEVYDQLSKEHPRNEEEEQNNSRRLLHVTWADGQESYYDMDWLYTFTAACHTTNTTSSSSTSSSSSSRVTKDIAIGAIHNSKAVPIPTLDYLHVMTTEEGRWEALHGIIEHGAILIRESPIQKVVQKQQEQQQEEEEIESDQIVADMGKRLSGGRLSHGSLYGDTFRVVSQPQAHNIAYTTVALPPHQDLTYYESKPFLQLLHCVSNAATGGASILIDAMAATEYLREVAPDLFDTLCQVEATFVKQRPGADMVSFKSHIVTSKQNNEVIEINWSPPFEGPPVILSPNGSSSSSSITTTTINMEDYIRAYQAMECLLNNHQFGEASSSSSLLDSTTLQQQLQTYAHDFTWEYILQPGEMLIFNNQRMCHGRRSFALLSSNRQDDDDDDDDGDNHNNNDDHGSHRRHLIGCYTDAMETINEYRLLLRRRQDRYPKQDIPPLRNAGNSTRAS